MFGHFRGSRMTVVLMAHAQLVVGDGDGARPGIGGLVTGRIVSGDDEVDEIEPEGMAGGRDHEALADLLLLEWQQHGLLCEGVVGELPEERHPSTPQLDIEIRIDATVLPQDAVAGHVIQLDGGSEREDASGVLRGDLTHNWRQVLVVPQPYHEALGDLPAA